MQRIVICTIQWTLGWVGHVECLGDKRNEYSVLVGMHERTRRLGMLGVSWVDNIKVNLDRNTIGTCGLDLSGSG